MRNVGEHEHVAVATYETIEFNPMDIFEAVETEVRVLQYDFEVEPDFILMGTEDFSRLTRTAYQHCILHINHRWFAEDLHNKRMRGLDIRLSPTIQGYCVVPKAR
jgi:hypothetical protein